MEAGIEIGAIKTAAGGDTWAIGGLLSGIVGGSDKDPSALANFLKSLLIKFNVQDEFKDVIGLRIAGNVNLGALLSGNTKDTMQIVKALLMKSDLAVELTDGYPWAATKTVVGLYVTEGTIYININGDKTIKDTKLKIGVDKVLGMVGGASTGALASADLGVEGILSIVNNIVREISIYRNDEASGMTISLSKNMLGAILQLVADIDGVDLKLNETNSFIELNTKVTDKKPYLLKLSVGIDPLVLGIALGGLKIGLAANSDVLKNLNKTDYKGLSDSSLQRFYEKTRGGWSKELIAFRKDAFKEYLILGIHPKELDIKRQISDEEKIAAFAKAGGVCENCGKKLKDYKEAEYHHIELYSEGGETKIDNIMVLCPECHKEKHREKPNGRDIDEREPFAKEETDDSLSDEDFDEFEDEDEDDDENEFDETVEE